MIYFVYTYYVYDQKSRMRAKNRQRGSQSLLAIGKAVVAAL